MSGLLEIFGNNILLHCWNQMIFSLPQNSSDINTFSLCALATNLYNMWTYFYGLYPEWGKGGRCEHFRIF